MISIFLYAFAISLVVLIIVIFLSHKHELFIDHSHDEKPQNFHTDCTPRAGGLGVLAGMLVLIFVPFGLKFVPSILLAFFSGIFEDFHSSLSPRVRLALQVIAATSAVLITDSVVTYLGLGISMPYWMGIIFSVFAIVGMMNAVNIIDGFNGLASGVIMLILLSFAVVSYQQNNLDILSITLISLGATLGFLILNFPKGKIFLGDGGAYMLGFIVAMIGIFLASKYEGVSPWYILAVFIYPVWEVIFSIYRKKKAGRSPMEPDAYHIHMLIFKHLTKNNPLTSVFILVSVAPFMLLSTLYAANSGVNILIIVIFVLCYTLLYRYLSKKENTIV